MHLLIILGVAFFVLGPEGSQTSLARPDGASERCSGSANGSTTRSRDCLTMVGRPRPTPRLAAVGLTTHAEGSTGWKPEPRTRGCRGSGVLRVNRRGRPAVG